MRSMEEDPNPDFNKLKNFLSTEPTCTSGASVSKPMDRNTEYGRVKEQNDAEAKPPQDRCSKA